MIPNDLGEEYRQIPDRLIGTRWEAITSDARLFEVVHVIAEGAILFTLFQDDTFRIVVPIEVILSPFSSFNYVGRAEDLSWIVRGAQVVSINSPTAVYQISYIYHRGVICHSPYDARIAQTYIYSGFATVMRLASTAEIQAAREQHLHRLGAFGEIENGIAQEGDVGRVEDPAPEDPTSQILFQESEKPREGIGRLLSWDHLSLEGPFDE